MTMPWPYARTYTAGTDLSSSLWRLVSVDSSGVYANVATSANSGGTYPIGVATYNSRSGEAVGVGLAGPWKIEAANSFAAGVPLTANSVGQAVLATAGQISPCLALQRGEPGRIVYAMFGRAVRVASGDI